MLYHRERLGSFSVICNYAFTPLLSFLFVSVTVEGFVDTEAVRGSSSPFEGDVAPEALRHEAPYAVDYRPFAVYDGNALFE